jgi:hypothetical protein
MKLRLPVVATLFALATASLFAAQDVYYISARPNPSGTGGNLTNCPSCDYNEVGVLLGDTSAKSSATGVPSRDGSRYYAKSAPLEDNTVGFDINPKLNVPGATYILEYTANASAGNVTTNGVYSASGSVCTLSFTNTDKFQRKYGTNGWVFIGYVTNDPGQASPTVSFRWESGMISASNANRLVLDTFRFTELQSCSTIPTVTVGGPLAAGATSQVTVSGIATNATAVTVYQNNGSGSVQVGRTTTGIAGTTVVTCSNLVKGAQVSATQTIGGIEGCVQSSGTIVGGGANPRLRLALSVRYNNTLTGPIGADGGAGSACIWFLGATNILSGAAPGDCKNVIYPSNNWQTVSFQRDGDATNGPDASIIWNNAGCGASLDTQFAVLEGIAIAEDDTTDTGPVDIYIDNIKNGSTTIMDFESGTPGSAFGFLTPTFSGTTSANLLAAPNVAAVSTNAADTGLQSLRVRFQYNRLNSNAWVRLSTANAAVMPNPEIDLTQPISFRILMIPVGGTLPAVIVPKLTFSQSAGQITLNWAGTFKLQYKNSLSDANWTDTGVTSGPYNIPAPLNTSRFYRLQGQ